LRDSFVACEEFMVIPWTTNKRQKWPQTGRQRSRRREAPPNG